MRTESPASKHYAYHLVKLPFIALPCRTSDSVRMNTQQLSDRLDLLLVDMGWNKAQLAAAAGSSPQAVTTWYSRQSIGKKSAKAICEAAGVSLEWLLDGKGDMRPTKQPFTSISIPITQALTPAADGITVTAESCDQGVVLLPAVSPKDYAAVITTSGLLPRIERDQVAVIAPTLPVLEGDMVLIAMASGDLLLCRWLYDRGDVRYVEPVNGGDRRELQRSAIRDCHYVAQVLNKPRQLAH